MHSLVQGPTQVWQLQKSRKNFKFPICWYMASFEGRLMLPTVPSRKVVMPGERAVLGDLAAIMR